MRYGPGSASSRIPDRSRVIAAAIDVGTNTTRLLVAEVEDGRITPLAADGVMTALGAGLDDSGLIAQAGLDLVAQTTAAMSERAHALGAERLVIACTAIGRDAENAADLLERISAATGTVPRVLTGAQEAELTYFGLVAAGAAGDDLVAADLGGGSLELMGGHRGDLEWATSLPVGVRRLTERHRIGDPPAVAAWEPIAAEVAALVAPIAADHPAAAVVATGGSAVALGALSGSGRLDGATLAGIPAALAGRPAHEVAAATGLDPARIRLCLAGAGALEGVRRAFGLDGLEISEAGLREGLVLEATG
jgi:exopolyphosphatase / guanosine-5'-triphosphate,3'-diphosphate pyrophosphatase